MSTPFGQAVRAARIAKGISQELLASAANTTQSSIDRIERGETARSRVAPEVAAILGIPYPYPNGRMPSLPNDQPAFEMPVAVVPLYVASEGPSGTILVDNRPIDDLTFSWGVKEGDESFCITIPDYSMFPAFEAGDIIVVAPKSPVIRDSHVIICGHPDGDFYPAALRRLTDWSTEAWNVKIWNPAKGQATEETFSREQWPRAMRIIAKFSR